MKKKKPTTSKDTADDESGEGGEGGEGGSGGSIVPSYYDIFGTNIDEAEVTALAVQALLENRIAIKSKGIAVSALDKPQEARNKLQNDNTNPAQDGGGGLGLEDHPELAEMGGMVDPNVIVLPKSEQDILAVKDMDLRLALQARLTAKAKAQPKPGMVEQPRPTLTIRPSSPPPRPRPRPF